MKTLHCSLLVYGGTAPGIVAAVRGAREGLEVVLVTPSRYLGGALPSLGAIETHYRGVRAPLLQEFIDRVVGYYRDTFGEQSAQYRACTEGMMTTFEPGVAEAILRNWVAAESRIRWLASYRPVVVERAGFVLDAVHFGSTTVNDQLRVCSKAFVEASYEGDLMAMAGASFRIGRESRSEYDEPRAGRVFTTWCNGIHPRDAAEGRLNLVTAKATTSEPLAGSTGEGDDNIQSYSYRLCLTDRPEIRRSLPEPPLHYDRERFAPILLSPAEKERLHLPFHHRFLLYSLREMANRDHIFHGHALPNRKRSWNATNFTGAGKRYPAAEPAERRKVEQLHLEHALGLLWFLQNDPAVPEDLRNRALAWGLAADEFVESDNIPPQLYVREARRLRGRAVFSEHDALIAPGLNRAPIHQDSIGITEFSLDSLACTTERLPGAGALCDGQLFQMEVSRPGQVAFGTLLAPTIDNLVVVTTVSATHVGWGTVRQTPTLMHLAESAAWVCILAAADGVAPANVGLSRLQRELVERGIMISFFNDCDTGTKHSWTPAVQFLGTKGLFGSYDARPLEPLSAEVAKVWRRLLDPSIEWEPNRAAREVLAAERAASVAITRAEFETCLSRFHVDKDFASSSDRQTREPLLRGSACEILFAALIHRDPLAPGSSA